MQVMRDYEKVRIRIALNPTSEKFEVSNPAIRLDSSWIPDVASVFHPDASVFDLTDTYAERNAEADRRAVARVLERLRKIVYNHVSIIELAHDLDIEQSRPRILRSHPLGLVVSERPAGRVVRLDLGCNALGFRGSRES